MLGDDRRMRDDFLARLNAWRAVPHEEQLARMAERAGGRRFPSDAPDGGKLRVGLVSPNCYLGGAERWISDLLDHCDGSRIHWTGVAIKAEPSGPEVPTVRADWEEHCPVASGDAAIAALGRASDVLLTWGVVGFRWGISSARLASLLPAGPPVVSVSHGPVAYPGIDDEAPATIPVAVSRCAIRGLPRVQRPGARVILNGVSPARVARTRSREHMHREWGVPPGSKVVGWLARVASEKRPRVWIDAVAALPPDWVGAMAGIGMDLDDARRHAEAVAPGRVRFLGARRDVGDVLGGFDVLATPSAAEACSLAMAEAWLAGVPTVSTPVGLLEPGDHPELARLVPDPPTGADLAAAILADEADPAGTAARVVLARSFARTSLATARFGRDWTDLLCSLAVPRAAKLAMVAACPDRGPELPVSDPTYASGCCSGSTMHECRANKGRIPGKPVLRECLECCESSRLSQ
jgi:glycosyltransferase involved in cell wall biosynthesis